MSKVEILSKGGRVARVHPKIADVLVQRGTYIRRDIVAEPAASSPIAPVAPVQQSSQEPSAGRAQPVVGEAGHARAKKKGGKKHSSEGASE
ncbi:hypothetical protein HEP73_02167 [Xanthomonas sp. GW]|uniref:hypothetical protein n=1 Tax=Xanthomonas sp. GW TaxID=2724121 RepID=UPI00163AB4CD|nr:hypothetical protein [Xanthomonas sp. GW]QNH21253.1 hypothetical protein HEP73_02167 [Xanthomonas sp. GW]